MLHLIAEFFQGRITSLDGALAGGKADSESESEPEDGAPAKAKKMPALLVPVQVRLFYICTVPFHPNPAHNLTRSPYHLWTRAGSRAGTASLAGHLIRHDAAPL